MFERVGIAGFVKGCSEEDSVDLLGYNTKFRHVVSKFVESAVKSGQWFSFCMRASESQVDLMSIKNASEDTLGHLVSGSYPETIYRSAVYKYLLLDYLCYVEQPSVKKEYGSNSYTGTFDKYLATSNIEVVAKWMDIDVGEAMSKYGMNLTDCVNDNGCDMFPFVKLWTDKQGVHKVTKPRKELDLSKSGTRVVPLFALKQGVDTLFSLASKDFYRVSFMKDSSQIRNIVITFNAVKIRDIYGDTDFFRDGVNAMYSGDFLDNPNLGRGYIRVFEVGGSIYDSPTRSINYARIASVEKVEEDELDLSYINIDLNSVQTAFSAGVMTSYKHSAEIVESLKDFDVSGSDKLKEHATSNDLDYWATSQVTLLSTTFLRELALFMIANPQWFNGYTGQPANSKGVPSESSDAGSAMPDFGFDFDIG